MVVVEDILSYAAQLNVSKIISFMKVDTYLVILPCKKVIYFFHVTVDFHHIGFISFEKYVFFLRKKGFTESGKMDILVIDIIKP